MTHESSRGPFTTLSFKNLHRYLLLTACGAGSLEVVKMLVKLGVGFLDERPSRATLLEEAAHGGHVKVVSFLLDNGAEPDRKRASTTQVSALVGACQNGHIDVARLLLDNCANPNRMGPLEKTALSEAARHEHVDILKMLLERGASWDFEGSGYKALSHAVTIGSISLLRFLIASGADPKKHVPMNAINPLMLEALRYGDDTMLEILRRLGAPEVDPINSKYEQGFRDGRFPRPRSRIMLKN